VTTTPPSGPLTPEELASLPDLRDPVISPDGRQVVFSSAPFGREKEHPARTIWRSIDGAAATPFTAGVADDHSPAWAPDGARLAFLSDRLERGTYRLFTIAAAGGEARPLGAIDGALSGPHWSPDGTRIAILRTDPLTADEKKRREDARDDAEVVEESDKRTRLWLVDAATGAHRCLTTGALNIWSFAWNRDGSTLAVVATPTPDYDATIAPTTVALVAASGGVPRTIATFPVAPADLVFVETPTGPAVAARANQHRSNPVDSVWLVPVGGGDPIDALPAHHGNVDWIGPHPTDPGSIVCRIVEGTHARIYRLAFDGEGLEALTPPAHHEDGSVVDGPAFSADGTQMAYIWSDGSSVHEVYRAAPRNAPTRLTDIGAAINPRLCPVEVVRWTCDGHEIEGLLTYPVGYVAGQRYPLVVEIHGGPSWQWEDYAFVNWHDWAQMLATRGYAVLAPNPRGSTGRGAAFQQALQDDVGGGESRDLVAGALAMVERGIADPDRLGIGGWSWGGYLTAFTITQTTIFKAAVMGAGLANMLSDHGSGDIPSANLLYFPGHPYHHPETYWQSSALKHITNCVTPTLILHGAEDNRVHPAQGAEMFRALKVLGVPTQFVRYPREPHGIKERAHQIDLMTRIIAWYGKYLQP
jgi:dipeptidyl aminopeptidase/acylaminoacyl peptidase